MKRKANLISSSIRNCNIHDKKTKSAKTTRVMISMPNVFDPDPYKNLGFDFLPTELWYICIEYYADTDEESDEKWSDIANKFRTSAVFDIKVDLYLLQNDFRLWKKSPIRHIHHIFFELALQSLTLNTEVLCNIIEQFYSLKINNNGFVHGYVNRVYFEESIPLTNKLLEQCYLDPQKLTTKGKKKLFNIQQFLLTLLANSSL